VADSLLPVVPAAAEPPAQEAARGKGGLSSWLLGRVDLLLRLGLLIIIIIAGVFFTLATIPQGENITQATYISAGNLQDIARQMAVIGVIAIGETFVIITAGIDLSVGSLLGMCGIMFALMSVAGWPIVLALLGVLAFALLIGLINGLLVSTAGVPPFIVTLGFLGILRGGAYLLSGGTNSALTPDASTPPLAQWAEGTYLGIPTLFLILAAVAIVSYIFLRFTRRGRYIYAQGSNPESARLAGINVRATLLTVYAISGLLAGVAGVMLTLRLNGANPNNGLSYELDAIAAAVLGGASLFGAKGTILGTFLGVLLVNMLAIGIDLVNVDPHLQQVIEGALLIVIVWLDQWRKRRLISAV